MTIFIPYSRGQIGRFYEFIRGRTLNSDPMIEKTIFAADLKEGMQIDAPFVVDDAELREKRNGKYIYLTISDRTGKKACKVWGSSDQNADQIEAFFNEIRPGEVYQIQGYAKNFNSNCEINVNEGIINFTAAVPAHSIDPSQFVHAPTDEKSIRQGLASMISRIEDHGISSLVVDILSNTPEFFEVPAAKYKHHAYIGGLAEHTLETTEIALDLASKINRVDMDADILLAGALLHDIGKTNCFLRQGFSFITLPEHTLVGHTALGAAALLQHSDRVDPSRFAHLLHIVMTHHGPYGEVKPQTPEAWAVHFADNASATLRATCDDVADLEPGETRHGALTRQMVHRF